MTPQPQPQSPPRSVGHAGAFALGTFAARGRRFAGLVVGDLVRDLTDAADAIGLGVPGPVSVNSLLSSWDESFARLAELAESTAPDGTWVPLAQVRALPPGEPRQTLQSGATYPKHAGGPVI